MKIPMKRFKKASPEAVIASAWSNASNFNSEVPTAPDQVSPSGGSFYIKTLLPIGVPTGDSRKFQVNSISHRDLPLPLLWQEKTDAGHAGSVVVGRIDSIEITDTGAGEVRGVFDTNPYAREVERMIRDGFIRGVSADLDKFSATEEPGDKLSSDNQSETKKVIKNKELIIEEARIMGVTVVAMPAFQEATIVLENPTSEDSLEEFEDGVYEDGVLEQESLSAMIASAAPLTPPREWFQRFDAHEPMPITVEDNGRVYGYLALWKADHIGYRTSQKPPRSLSNYKYFRSGVVRTDDGTDVTVGNLTLVGGHAPMSASAQQAVKHYDDTASAVADVVAGEDRFGIWVAGALRPTVTPEQVRAMRASGISGDWRPINGKLELVAACFVNVPGFPTTRAMVASGQITALVAAGVQELEMMRSERDIHASDMAVLQDALHNDLDEKAREAFNLMYGEELREKEQKALAIMFEDEIEETYRAALSMMDDN